MIRERVAPHRPTVEPIKAGVLRWISEDQRIALDQCILHAGSLSYD